MLSYRHSYHAGNFADVIKHLILIRILRHLAAKDKPLCYIDTHAGSGGYSLEGGPALQNREFASGIGKLWQRTDMPEVVADYVEQIREFNPGNRLRRYPGSPWFAQHLLRPQDRLLLHERHSTDVELLRRRCASDSRINISAEDGFAGAIALLPPRERRGLVLIDPSYEIKTDYASVVDTLVRAHRRFATGLYAIWYPVVDRQRVRKLEQAIKTSGIRNVQLFELCIKPDVPSHGMTGSGMLVINPPWTLASDMRAALPYLATVLGEAGGSGQEGSYRIETLIAE
ncbi:MAG: 23S rRNA (adenine(2030)-N(6))-methyltransferase RlmJ [Porticoccaceae bacterium]